MLIAEGVRIKVLDNFSRGNASSLEGVEVELIHGDVRDPDAISLAANGVEAIVHLAAFGSVVESVSNPDENFDVNVRGTLTVLRAAARKQVKLVFASSGGAVIGETKPPVNEESLPKPASPYGASKLCGEAYCHAFAASFGLSTVALRFANVYGPHSAHKKGAVTNFIAAITAGQPMVIFGDGSATRDFIYVADICAGIRAALNTQVPPGTVLHLATGIETSIRGLAKTLARTVGNPDYPIRYESKRAGELEHNFATFDRANEAIGFSPQVTLEKGLEKTVEWFRVQSQDVLRATRTDS